MAATTLALSLVMFIDTARAEQPVVSLKQLLNVTPTSHSTVGARAPAQLVAQASSESPPAGQVDDETPAALSGVPTPQPSDETVTKPAARADDGDDSVFKTWWFWALTAAVVGGTVALGVWAAQPQDQSAGSCSPGVIACFGDGR